MTNALLRLGHAYVTRGAVDEALLCYDKGAALAERVAGTHIQQRLALADAHLRELAGCRKRARGDGGSDSGDSNSGSDTGNDSDNDDDSAPESDVATRLASAVQVRVLWASACPG